jgi:NAD(P)-dependent dehydrogenase (short-subunit alcohol dehydrogenase family)
MNPKREPLVRHPLAGRRVLIVGGSSGIGRAAGVAACMAGAVDAMGGLDAGALPVMQSEDVAATVVSVLASPVCLMSVNVHADPSNGAT